MEWIIDFGVIYRSVHYLEMQNMLMKKLHCRVCRSFIFAFLPVQVQLDLMVERETIDNVIVSP